MINLERLSGRNIVLVTREALFQMRADVVYTCFYGCSQSEQNRIQELTLLLG